MTFKELGRLGDKPKTCLGKKVNHVNPEDRQLTLFIQGDGRDLSVVLDRLRQKKLAIDFDGYPQTNTRRCLLDSDQIEPKTKTGED